MKTLCWLHPIFKSITSRQSLQGILSIKIIRNTLEFKDIPVFAISASFSKENKTNIKDLGFNEYLIKPINISELLNALKNYLPYEIIQHENIQHENIQIKETQLINKDNIHNMDEFIHLLKSEFQPQCIKLKETMLVDKIAEFGIKISKLSKNYNAYYFEEIGNNIVKYCKNFDILSMEKEIDKLCFEISKFKYTS